MSSGRGRLDRILAEFTKLIDNKLTTDCPHDKENGTYHDEKPAKRIWTSDSKQSLAFGTFLFLSLAATGLLTSYLTLYYKQIGFNASEIGIITSVQSWVSFPFTPLLGYAADKYTIGRLLLTGSVIAASFTNFVQNYVPRVRYVDCELLPQCNGLSFVEQQKFNSNYTMTTYIVNSQEPYTTVNVNSGQQVLQPLSNDSVVCNPDETDNGFLYNGYDLQNVLIYLTLVGTVCKIVGAPWYPLSSTVILKALGPEKRNHYAYYRGIGGVGFAVGILAGGVMLEMAQYQFKHCGLTKTNTNFFLCFATYFLLRIVSAPVAWMMSDEESFKKKSEETKPYQFMDVLRALCNLHYGSAILTIAWLSIATAKMRTYDYWYMQALGGSYLLMGWGGFISQLAMIITFCFLPVLNEKFGHIPFLVLSCLATGVGCLICAIITSAEWMLIPIFLREMAVAAFSQSSGAFLANAVDSGHQATLQSLMSALTFGLGRGLGSLLGGGLIHELSVAMSYYIFAIVSFMMGVLLIVAQAIFQVGILLGKK